MPFCHFCRFCAVPACKWPGIRTFATSPRAWNNQESSFSRVNNQESRLPEGGMTLPEYYPALLCTLPWCTLPYPAVLHHPGYTRYYTALGTPCHPLGHLREASRHPWDTSGKPGVEP